MKKEAGFTLVELAIVLVIIGIILGMVLKGQDLIRGARIKQYDTKFVRAWEIVFYDYQDRTGHILGDGTANGGTAATENGYADYNNGTSNMATICSTILPEVGLTAPITNTQYCYEENMSGKYADSLVDLVVTSRKLTVDGSLSQFNVLCLSNVPTDVAIALDKIIDGKTDSSTGSFLGVSSSSAFSPTILPSWPAANSQTTVDCVYILD